MRRQSLKFKITIYLTVALTAAVFLFSLLLIRNQREEMLEQAVNHVNQLSEVIIKSTRFAMLQNQPSYIDQIIHDVGAEEDIDRVRILGKDGGATTLYQEGRAGLWFIKRGFRVKFRVRETPMAYIGFDAFEGDFKHFKGAWQVDEREEGTWVSHKVEIQPAFYAPKWAIRQVARDLMADTIDGVIRRCFATDVTTP